MIVSEGEASKALALVTGVDATSSDTIVFFDADLLGATPAHFEQLAAPIAGGFAMSLGLVDRGSLRNAFFMRLPPITGLRAVRRDVFDAVAAGKTNSPDTHPPTNQPTY